MKIIKNNFIITMMWIIKLLQKKICDKKIRILKVVFWTVYSVSLYYNLIYQGDAISNSILWINITEDNINIAKYIIISLWIIPILSWIFDLAIMKAKYARIFQIISWIWLFYIAWIIPDSLHLEVDTLIWFMWIFPLLWGITWKLITTKASKYWYKITKIRV